MPLDCEAVVCRFRARARPSDAELAQLGISDTHLSPIRFARGDFDDIPRLPVEHHGPKLLDDFRARLARNERWLIATRANVIAAYVWAHDRADVVYPYIKGCRLTLPSDAAYGFEAWTAPAHRGRGLRRRLFVEEMAAMDQMGRQWGIGIFRKEQLEGALRSLGGLGSDVTPVCRVWRTAGGSVGCVRLLDFPIGVDLAPSVALPR